MNLEYSKYWLYGYKQAITYAEKNMYKYEKVVLSNDFEQPYIFILLFAGFDPQAYLSWGGTPEDGTPVTGIGKYEIRRIDWPAEKRDTSILYIAPYGKIPPGNIETIKYPDGTPAIEIKDRE